MDKTEKAEIVTELAYAKLRRVFMAKVEGAVHEAAVELGAEFDLNPEEAQEMAMDLFKDLSGCVYF